MKCVFIASRYSVVVQYNSPEAVKAQATAWPFQVGSSQRTFSLFEGFPARIQSGGIGVFLPSELSRSERAALFTEFKAINPSFL